MIKLFRYLKKYWIFALLAPTFMVVEVAMDMMLAEYMAKMVDYGIQANNLDLVLHYGLIMVLILFIGVVGGVLSGVFTNLASYRFSNDLRKDVFAKIMNLSYHQTDHFTTGSLVTRVTNDITQVQNLISMALRMSIRAGSFFVLGIIFTLSISSDFGVLLLIILPIEIVFVFLFIKIVFPVFSVIQQKLDKVNTVVHENVSGARVVKSFSKEKYETSRFVEANNEYTEKNLYVSKITALMMPVLMLFVYVAQIIIYRIGGQSILDAYQGVLGYSDMLMVGEISQAITYVLMILMSIMMLGMMFTNLARAFASAKRINEILDTPLELMDGELDISTLHTKGIIEFQDVTYQYPNSHSPVLDHISFNINKGETIAILGSTGAGKSTLIHLISRFYDVTSGKVLINGVDVRDYKLKDLRNIISTSLQKTELFSGTIVENVQWGKEDASLEEIKEALDVSQARSFVEEKEHGYEEYIEEKGTSLSGGQKQRLSIARAIIRNPEILIFDDSTSALDLITEAKLYQQLKSKHNDVTKIVVVQRAATARNADRIMVLDKGKVIAFDTHDELILSCSIYKDIYESQMKQDGVLYE